jgi:hypothetical protein
MEHLPGKNLGTEKATNSDVSKEVENRAAP